MKLLSAEIPGKGLPLSAGGSATGSAVVGMSPSSLGEVTAVPEPSPLFLLIGALALVFLLRRGGNRS